MVEHHQVFGAVNAFHQLTECFSFGIGTVVPANDAQIAYRVRNEIAYYLSYAIEDNLLTFEQAMDNALMQKILPRIQGEGTRIQKGLGGILDAIIPGRNFAKAEDLLVEIDNYRKTAGSN